MPSLKQSYWNFERDFSVDNCFVGKVFFYYGILTNSRVFSPFNVIFNQFYTQKMKFFLTEKINLVLAFTQAD